MQYLNWKQNHSSAYRSTTSENTIMIITHKQNPHTLILSLSRTTTSSHIAQGLQNRFILYWNPIRLSNNLNVENSLEVVTKVHTYISTQPQTKHVYTEVHLVCMWGLGWLGRRFDVQYWSPADYQFVIKRVPEKRVHSLW